MANSMRLRTKTLKISCTEEDALAIVTPLVNITAYFLAVTRTDEMPSFSAISESVSTSKTRLAMLISNAVGKVVNPKHLNTISVEVIPIGGYFRVQLVESVENEKGGQTLQRYNITLGCITQCTLVEKISAVIKNENPNGLDSETLAVLTTKRLLKLGL